MGATQELVAQLRDDPGFLPRHSAYHLTLPGVSFLTKHFLYVRHSADHSTHVMPLNPVSRPVQEGKPSPGWQEVPQPQTSPTRQERGAGSQWQPEGNSQLSEELQVEAWKAPSSLEMSL